MNKAVFLDRDGVLIQDTGYPGDPESIIFLPNIGNAIKALNDKGYKVIVVTNQSGVARGYFPEENVRRINQKIADKVRDAGGVIDRFYYCRHYPNENCSCRKPKPGMLLDAKKDFDIDFSKSYMIGDSESDMEAGRSVGCRLILLSREKISSYPTAEDLPSAIRLVA
jgi:D-glycero-D-manno-heptose 1,7-bisphosphate phosphatase